MNAPRTGVGLSGGVDSAAAAILLQRAGCDVTGFVMRLPVFSDDEATAQERTTGDARRVAECLGLPLVELDFRDLFEARVLAPFVGAYAAGLTPNPCVLCNRAIKFGALLEAARSEGCGAFATGHYAQVCHDDVTNRWQLLCAADLNQDQSYFLNQLTQEQLAFARFPIGHLTKNEVRAIAAEANLPVSQKRGSRDLCFLPGGDYRALLRERCPAACQPGPVCHAATGQRLGTHPGTAACTIGQRKGLGIATGEPLYVAEVDAVTHTVFVAPREGLRQAEFFVDSMNWISQPPPAAPVRLMARTRYRQPLFPVRVEPSGAGARVVPETPQDKAAPGQSAVFYENNKVVAGGTICHDTAMHHNPDGF